MNAHFFKDINAICAGMTMDPVKLATEKAEIAGKITALRAKAKVRCCGACCCALLRCLNDRMAILMCNGCWLIAIA